MATSKLLAFAGSLRRDSFNKKLVKIAADGARAAGAEVTILDLADFPMPIYDGDLEAKDGLPEHARRFREAMKAHNGLLIASPEYNSSVSAALKNAIDWASRPDAKIPGEPGLVAFGGKVAAIMSASPGALGGLRGLVHLRAILGNIQVLVLPEQLTVNTAHEAFTPDGSLKDAKKLEQAHTLGAKLAKIVAKLHG